LPNESNKTYILPREHEEHAPVASLWDQHACASRAIVCRQGKLGKVSIATEWMNLHALQSSARSNLAPWDHPGDGFHLYSAPHVKQRGEAQ
jgi:hypothetical protein